MNKETEIVENECNLQQQRLDQEFEQINKLLNLNQDSINIPKNDTHVLYKK